MITTFVDSPLGTVRITGDDAGVSVISCVYVTDSGAESNETPIRLMAGPVRQASDQLTEYFAGRAERSTSR